jgi:hypothetical protein
LHLQKKEKKRAATDGMLQKTKGDKQQGMTQISGHM